MLTDDPAPDAAPLHHELQVEPAHDVNQENVDVGGQLLPFRGVLSGFRFSA